MKNVRRLQHLQEAAYDSFLRNSDEHTDFKNILQPKSLDDFDSKLSKILTPEPNRYKAHDLMNVGSSIISSNNNLYNEHRPYATSDERPSSKLLYQYDFTKPITSRLDRIEENYQELASYDDAISYDLVPSKIVLLP